MNLMKLLQIKSAWDRFQDNHPKFPKFLQVVSKEAILEGTLVEVKVTTEEGRSYISNIKINNTDMQLIDEVQKILQDMKN